MKVNEKIVIIPAFNEEGNLIKTVEDIKKNASDFDYVIVNDCSTDETLAVCKQQHFSYLNLPVNLGIGGGCADRLQICVLSRL